MISSYKILLTIILIWSCDAAAPTLREPHHATPKPTTKTTQCARPFNYTSEATTVISSEADLTAKLTATTPST